MSGLAEPIIVAKPTTTTWLIRSCTYQKHIMLEDRRKVGMMIDWACQKKEGKITKEVAMEMKIKLNLISIVLLRRKKVTLTKKNYKIIDHFKMRGKILIYKVKKDMISLRKEKATSPFPSEIPASSWKAITPSNWLNPAPQIIS